MLPKRLTAIILTYMLASVAYAGEVAFEKKTLQIFSSDGAVSEFIVEVADSEEKQEYGLMDRKNMDKNHGMLFLFDKPREVNMWMKDTYIPLDMIFIKSDNTILKIVENTKPMSLETIASKEKIAAVVELNAGICKKFGIKENDRVAF